MFDKAYIVPSLYFIITDIALKFRSLTNLLAKTRCNYAMREKYWPYSMSNKSLFNVKAHRILLFFLSV